MPAPTVLVCGFQGLSAPSSLALVEARASQLDISWDGGGSARFLVYYRVQGATNWILDDPVGLDPSATAHTITELTPATAWEVSVTRWDPNTGEESSFNARLNVSTL
jgi:hypothetical protein